MGHPFGAVGEQLFGAVHAFGVAEDQLFGAVHAFGVAGSQFACFGDYPASFSDRSQCRAGEPFRLILPIGDLGKKLLYLIQAVCVMLGGAHGGFSCGPGPGRVGVAGLFLSHSIIPRQNGRSNAIGRSDGLDFVKKGTGFGQYCSG